jgi:signal transduction histidine kinase
MTSTQHRRDCMRSRRATRAISTAHQNTAVHMSIVARLVILALLALVPAIAAHAINEILLYRDLKLEIRHAALSNAQVRNAAMDGIVSGIEHLLGALVRLPAVTSLDRSSCDEQLALLTTEYPHDVVLAIADRNGVVMCSSVPRHANVAVSDRPVFGEVIDTGKFKVGEYVINPITSAKALSFGYPIHSQSGGTIGVAMAYLGLDWVASDMQRAPFLPGRMLIMADRNGIVLAQAPVGQVAVGQKLSAPLLGMIGAAAPGIAEMSDAQGGAVLYGYIPITVPPPNIYILFGIDQDIAFGPIYRAVWRSTALSLVSVLLALLIAWVVGIRLIRRPVGRLLDAAQCWQRGDYHVRARLRGRSSEIVDLGRAFDTMAEKLQLREHQLASANRAKDVMLAAAGHDLRQPLQIITTAVSALSRRALTEREKQHVQRADKAIDRLVGALDALIDASRLRYDMAQPQCEIFALDRLLKDIAEQWSVKAMEKGLCLRILPCKAVVESDPRMLATIVHNLVGNAIKYTDFGGILMGCRRRRTEIWIEIYDTGIGIPADQVDAVFGEFQQLDTQREGLGLGLWIAANTAETLRHQLSVRSIVGRGSRFRIVVPLATARAGAAVKLTTSAS